MNYEKASQIKDIDFFPCIWVLDPIKLNAKSGVNNSSCNNKKIYNLSESPNEFINSDVKFTCNNGKVSNLNNIYPTAVYAPYSNERVYHQAGAYTLFPRIHKANGGDCLKETCINCYQKLLDLENNDDAYEYLYKY